MTWNHLVKSLFTVLVIHCKDILLVFSTHVGKHSLDNSLCILKFTPMTLGISKKVMGLISQENQLKTLL